MSEVFPTVYIKKTYINILTEHNKNIKKDPNYIIYGFQLDIEFWGEKLHNNSITKHPPIDSPTLRHVENAGSDQHTSDALTVDYRTHTLSWQNRVEPKMLAFGNALDCVELCCV